MRQVLVLLQTKKVLTRPWCLLELHAAINHGIPVLPIKVVKPLSAEGKDQNYDFAEAAHFLRHLDAELPKENPGASWN